MSDPTPPHAPAAAYSWLVGFDGDWRDTWWSQDFLELVAARLGLAGLRSLVDVGCGVGHWGQRLLPLLRPDATLVGFDREPAFVARAAAAAQARGLGERAVYQAALAETLPLATGSADLVTCQTVLIHVADPAVVVAEMARVARPGGLVLAAEPNNFGEKASALVAAPGLSRAERLALLELEAVVQDGKRLAGSGDSSVGERLPGLFAAAGLCDVRVCQNEKCAPLIPPYETPGEREELRQMLTWIDGGVWLGAGGTREQTQAWYLCGGGDPARFDELWAVALCEAQAWKAGVLAGTVSGARGPSFYLVSGRSRP